MTSTPVLDSQSGLDIAREATRRPGAMTVFLLDDHELARRGMRRFIESDPGFTVVGEAATATEALAAIPHLQPDIAILDLQLQDGDGISVCRQLRVLAPRVRSLIVSACDDESRISESIHAGAAGYVLKQVRGPGFVDAIRALAAGATSIDPDVTTIVMRRIRAVGAFNDSLRTLTQQERRILALLGEGNSNREIGDQVALAEKTVRNSVSILLNKLGMQSRTQAAVLWRDLHSSINP